MIPGPSRLLFFSLLIEDIQITKGSYAAERALFNFEKSFLPKIFELSLTHLSSLTSDDMPHLPEILSLLRASLAFEFSGSSRLAKKRSGFNFPEQLPNLIYPMIEEQPIWF